MTFEGSTLHLCNSNDFFISVTVAILMMIDDNKFWDLTCGGSYDTTIAKVDRAEQCIALHCNV